MKSVLISIKPKWCELIASGKKTVEVRKTKPKIDTPFKCYIYETLGKMKWDVLEIPEDQGGGVFDIRVHEGCGKVIGEFVCDKVADMRDINLEPICLTIDEWLKYTDKHKGVVWGWHISDLKIYDKPKELSEFWAYNEELHKRYDSERDFCCYDSSNEYGEPLTDCGDAYNNILNCYRCWEEWSGWCHHVTSPPQSWCYVEELP